MSQMNRTSITFLLQTVQTRKLEAGKQGIEMVIRWILNYFISVTGGSHWPTKLSMNSSLC
jgi:hypothetical protein